MTGAERAIRWSTIAAVAAVAIVAGWVSYEHALAVVRAHGEHGAVARLYPATVDGLIYSASMVLLDSARRGVPAPRLARWLLAAGIAATLAANVASGLYFGLVGAVVAAWPAAALVGSYELLMLIIRSGEVVHQREVGAVPAAYPAGPERPSADAEMDRLISWLTSGSNGVPDVPEQHSEAVSLFAAELARGELPSIRAIRSGLRCGQDRATEVQAYLRSLVTAPQGARDGGP